MAHSYLQRIYEVSINMIVTSVANVNAPNHIYNVTVNIAHSHLHHNAHVPGVCWTSRPTRATSVCHPIWHPFDTLYDTLMTLYIPTPYMTPYISRSIYMTRPKCVLDITYHLSNVRLATCSNMTPNSIPNMPPYIFSICIYNTSQVCGRHRVPPEQPTPRHLLQYDTLFDIGWLRLVGSLKL